MSFSRRWFWLAGALLSSFLVAPSAVAEIGDKESWVGLSAFGIQSNRFQGKTCTNFLRAIDQSPKPAIAVLFETFGKKATCLKRFWTNARTTNKKQLTEIHFSNEAGRRNQMVDRYDFHRELDVDEYNELLEEMPDWFEEEVRLRVRRIMKLIAGYEDTGYFVLSSGLEDNYTTLAWQNLYSVLKSEWPWELARSEVFSSKMRRQKWEVPPDLYREYHDYKRTFQNQGLCIANGDGQDVNFLEKTGLNFRSMAAANRGQVEAWLRRGKSKNCLMFLWVGKWQGFFSSSGTPKPLQRKFKFDESDIAGVRPFLLGEESIPSD